MIHLEKVEQRRRHPFKLTYLYREVNLRKILEILHDSSDNWVVLHDKDTHMISVMYFACGADSNDFKKLRDADLLHVNSTREKLCGCDSMNASCVVKHRDTVIHIAIDSLRSKHKEVVHSV